MISVDLSQANFRERRFQALGRIKPRRRAEAAKNPGPVANVLLLFWEGYVVDGDVDLPNLQAGEAFDAPYHVLAQGIRHLMNRPAVHNVYRQIERRLLFANIHGDAAGAATPAGQVAHELPDGGGGVARQPGEI